MELGDHYRRRPIGEVAAELVEVARAGARELHEVEQIENVVGDYLARTRAAERADLNGNAWLAEAKRRLPADLFAEVQSAIANGPQIGSVRGVRFTDDEEG